MNTIHYGAEFDYMGKRLRVIRSGENTCTLQDKKGNIYPMNKEDLLQVVK